MKDLIVKTVITALWLVLVYFAVIVQHPGAFNLYSFIVYLVSFLLAFIYFAIFTAYDSVMSGLTKKYKQPTFLHYLGWVVAVCAASVLSYNGYVFLPLLVMMNALLSFSLFKIQENYIERQKTEQNLIDVLSKINLKK